jgi:hypothetical protein
MGRLRAGSWAVERWCLVLVARMVGWMNHTLPIDTDQGL